MSIPTSGALSRWEPKSMGSGTSGGVAGPNRGGGGASSITLAVITSSTDDIGPALAIERAALVNRMIWKTNSPPNTPQPRLCDTSMRPMATTVMIPRRPRVLRASGRRLFSTSLAATRATELPIILKLKRPRPRPMHAPNPTSTLPKDTEAMSAATPTTRAMDVVRRATSPTFGSSKWANISLPPGRWSQVLAHPGDRGEHGRGDAQNQTDQGEHRAGPQPSIDQVPECPAHQNGHRQGESQGQELDSPCPE